jgi:hypothetical protein
VIEAVAAHRDELDGGRLGAMKHTWTLSLALAIVVGVLVTAWWYVASTDDAAANVVAARANAAERSSARGEALEQPERTVAEAANADSALAPASAGARELAPRERVATPRRPGTDIFGSVIQKNGKQRKIRDVTLRFAGVGGSDLALAIDGDYVAPALKPGKWTVHADVPGYAPFTSEFDVLEQAMPQRVDFYLERLPHLKIKMLTRSGEELTEAMQRMRSKERDGPSLSGASASTAKLEPMAVATRTPPGARLGATLEDGYESYGRGTYWPRAKLLRTSTTSSMTTVSIESNGPFEFNRSIPNAVNGTDADGSNVSSATRANVESASRDGISSRPVLSPDDLTSTEPYSGILALADPLPAYVSVTLADVVLQTQFVPFGAEEVVFHISTDELAGNAGGLRFRLVDDETGRPITQGRVGLHSNGKYGTGREIIDPNGYVVFDSEAPGPRHLCIVAKGYEWVLEQVHIDAGYVTDLGTIRLQRPITIAGDVLDENGQPVRAWVSLWPLERYDATMRINEHFCWRSDENGHFEIRPAGRHKYVVRLNDDDWDGAPVSVDATSGTIAGVRLRATKGSNVSVNFDPETPRGARLRVADAQGLPVAERAVDAKRKTKVRLAPGRYHMNVDFGEESYGDRNVLVDSSPLEVLLAP